MDESWTFLTSTGPSLQPAKAETKTIEDPGCAAHETTYRRQEGLRGEVEDRDTEIRRAVATATTVQDDVVPARKTRVFLSGTLCLVPSFHKTTSENADSHNLSADDTTIARYATDISHDGFDAIRSHPTRTE